MIRPNFHTLQLEELLKLFWTHRLDPDYISALSSKMDYTRKTSVIPPRETSR